jgi:hypothetical protein
MGIGAGGSTVSDTLLLSNKLNASYRQDDYFFFFSFSSAAAVKSFMACSPVDSCLNSSPENPRNKNPSEQSADQHAAPGTLVSGR